MVWNKTEDCKNKTWTHCEIIKMEVNETFTRTNCTKEKNVTWIDCVKMENATTTYNMTCKPRASLSCKPVITPLCQNVTWMDSYQVPVTICIKKPVWVPHQEFVHRKMCLCDDDDPWCSNTPTIIPPKLKKGNKNGLNNGDIVEYDFFPGK